MRSVAAWLVELSISEVTFVRTRPNHGSAGLVSANPFQVNIRPSPLSGSFRGTRNILISLAGHDLATL